MYVGMRCNDDGNRRKKASNSYNGRRATECEMCCAELNWAEFGWLSFSYVCVYSGAAAAIACHCLLQSGCGESGRV